MRALAAALALALLVAGPAQAEPAAGFTVLRGSVAPGREPGTTIVTTDGSDTRFYLGARYRHHSVARAAWREQARAPYEVRFDFQLLTPGRWALEVGGLGLTPPEGPSVGLGQDAASRMAVDVLLDGPDGDLLVSDRTARVLRVPASGGTPRVWAELPARRESHGLAQDATHVYVETLASNEVFRIDRRTGAVALFTHTERAPAAVAVDATAVYWLDYTSPVTLRAKRKPLSSPTGARPGP